MDIVGLSLAEHRTEAVWIISRKVVQTITLQVGNYKFTSQPFIRYLGVIIDARPNFTQQVEDVSTKASGVRSALSRLMPNIEGPKQRRRALLSSVITLVFTYAIAIWADALQTQETRRKVPSFYRLSSLRVATA
ncbi:uncharacterized protein LOC107045640 [Diachasma alloeum]|uniref:uncharacterized protein LOC107045640 n=1 Tax=Diachasma alloeum TaxID=454923 RepID=UPI00073822A8|nr:uncharacterized protein LOC107045640 [Diachasma alloeum]